MNDKDELKCFKPRKGTEPLTVVMPEGERLSDIKMPRKRASLRDALSNMGMDQNEIDQIFNKK